MTQNATLLPDSGPAGRSLPIYERSTRANPLLDALARHASFERASFHTPGHKGRLNLAAGGARDEGIWSLDLTELSGLDDLTCPEGVIADIERRASALWQSADSIISVNGASACLAASMIAMSGRGSTVLVPRNAHRSIVNGLVLSGLFPIWYEPVWDDRWGLWGPVAATTAERVLEKSGSELAGMVVVSPTYAGALSDTAEIAAICHRLDIPLLVDEAHGAHFLPGTSMPASAIEHGADIVVHSLHKTLTAATQTGMLHLGRQSRIEAQSLRAALRLVQSSSPSYLLMATIEQAIQLVEGEGGRAALAGLLDLSRALADVFSAHEQIETYSPGCPTDPARSLVRVAGQPADCLYDALAHQGVFAEALIGSGALFMLGLGSDDTDIACLRASLADVLGEFPGRPPSTAFTGAIARPFRPAEVCQILSPRQASLLPQECVTASEAVGRIAAETYAPCPPGVPVIVPGQRVPEQILEFASLQQLRVVAQ